MKQTTNKRPVTKKPGAARHAGARPTPNSPDSSGVAIPTGSAPMPIRKHPAPVPRLEPPTATTSTPPQSSPVGKKTPARPVRPSSAVPTLDTPVPVPDTASVPASDETAAAKPAPAPAAAPTEAPGGERDEAVAAKPDPAAAAPGDAEKPSTEGAIGGPPVAVKATKAGKAWKQKPKRVAYQPGPSSSPKPAAVKTAPAPDAPPAPRTIAAPTSEPIDIAPPKTTPDQAPKVAPGPILKPKAAPVPRLEPAAEDESSSSAASAEKSKNGRKIWRSGNLATIVSLVPVLALVVLLVISTVTALSATTTAPTQQAASSWLLDNVDRDQRLIVDASMAPALRTAGWDGDDALWTVSSGSSGVDSPSSWRSADYIVTTDAVRDQSAGLPQIASAIANSVAVASFGTGQDAVEVRQVVPEGAVLASVAEARAAGIRAEYGAQLAQNTAVITSDADRALLTGGTVDERIISVLGALAAEGEVTVAGLPVIAGETDRPLRQVAISAIGGQSLVVDGERTTAASTLIDGLLGRFTPDSAFVREGNLVLRYPSSVDGFLD